MPDYDRYFCTMRDLSGKGGNLSRVKPIALKEGFDEPIIKFKFNIKSYDLVKLDEDSRIRS